MSSGVSQVAATAAQSPSTYHQSTDSSTGDTTSPHEASPSILGTSSFPTISGGVVGSSYFQPIASASDQRSATSNSNTLGSAKGTHIAVGQPDNTLRETLARRIRSFAYIKRCLSASGHPTPGAGPQNYAPQAQSWLDTVRVTRRSLESYYSSDAMRKRAGRYYVLGCSLAPTLDFTSSGEFVRAILAVINEVDAMGEGTDKDRTKMRNFFKSSIRGGGSTNAKRMASGVAECSTTYDGVGIGGPPLTTLGASGIELIGTHAPFPLDFLQTTITFLDLLQEIYCKFTLFLSSASGAALTGREIDGLPSHPAIEPVMVEYINKIDGRIKKIVATICKELDSLARHLIRHELASVDPQMAREVASPGEAPHSSTAAGSGTVNGYLNVEGGEAARSGTNLGGGTLGKSSAGIFTGSAPNLLNTVTAAQQQQHQHQTNTPPSASNVTTIHHISTAH